MPVIFFLIVLLHVSPTTVSLLCVLRNCSGAPARHQYCGKAGEPPQLHVVVSISLISLLCLYWHLPTCLFLSPCESGFVFTMSETNYFDKMNIKKKGKTLSCVFSRKTCGIKY